MVVQNAAIKVLRNLRCSNPLRRFASGVCAEAADGDAELAAGGAGEQRQIPVAGYHILDLHGGSRGDLRPARGLEIPDRKAQRRQQAQRAQQQEDIAFSHGRF